MPECQRADPREQQEYADSRPHERVARQAVSNQRLVRPVAGVGDGISGSVRARGPGGPEEEGRELPQLRRIGLRARRNGVVVAAVREHVGVVGGVCFERARTDRIDHQIARGRSEGIRAHEHGEARFQVRPWSGGERLVARSRLRPRPVVQDEDRFAVEPVGAPVGSDVAAVAPDRTHLHPSHGLPDVLPALDVRARNDHPAVRGDHAVGNRRGLQVDPRAHPAEHCKRREDDGDKCDPKPSHGVS